MAKSGGGGAFDRRTDKLPCHGMVTCLDMEWLTIEHKIKKTPEWKLEEVCQYLNNKRLKPVLKREDVTLRPEG